MHEERGKKKKEKKAGAQGGTKNSSANWLFSVQIKKRNEIEILPHERRFKPKTAGLQPDKVPPETQLCRCGFLLQKEAMMSTNSQNQNLAHAQRQPGNEKVHSDVQSVADRIRL